MTLIRSRVDSSGCNRILLQGKFELSPFRPIVGSPPCEIWCLLQSIVKGRLDSPMDQSSYRGTSIDVHNHHIWSIVSDLPQPSEGIQHFFLPSVDDGDGLDCNGDNTLDDQSGTSAAVPDPKVLHAVWPELYALHDLSRMPPAASTRPQKKDALVDYSKSILLTSTQYVETMELKQQHKEATLEEAKGRKEAEALKHTLQEA